MTNAEKYLKDGADVEEFVKDIFNPINKATNTTLEYTPYINSKELKKYLKKEKKPTLTEDERVILRNIQNGVPDKTLTIKRFNGELFVLIKETADVFEIYMFDHLFQSIKERRRIRN